MGGYIWMVDTWFSNVFHGKWDINDDWMVDMDIFMADFRGLVGDFP